VEAKEQDKATRKEIRVPTSHVDHADTNAGFNIALRPSIGRFNTDRDVLKGNTDTPKGATL
jgi:transposase